MPGLEFWSEDRRFGLHVGEEHVRRVLKTCRSARELETGGILIGRYSETHDRAFVVRVSGAPRDSRAGRTWFERGVEGLQKLLDSHWHRREGFYIGEWHFHPGAAPVPSDVDHRTMRRIAAASDFYNCPEPVLLVIGGDPSAQWSVSATVFPDGRIPIPLRRIEVGGEVRIAK